MGKYLKKIFRSKQRNIINSKKRKEVQLFAKLIGKKYLQTQNLKFHVDNQSLTCINPS